MSSAKNKSSAPSTSAWLRRLFVWLVGGGRPVLILAVVVGLLGGGVYVTWRKLGPKILSSSEYRVSPDQIEITRLPGWIHSDVRAEVLRDPTLDGTLSLMDDDLTERIAKAFAAHPWVAKVGPVTKEFPALVKVPLIYRRPVCMVEVTDGVYAVDVEGVVLPSEDFSPVEAARFPRVSGIGRKPTGPAGARWGDARVMGGAEIAAALGPVWDALKLYRIVPLDADPTATNAGGNLGRRSMEPVFALVTRAGTQILWGYAPGANMLGELTPAEKVARLQQYLAEHDTFDVAGNQPPLDVRTMKKAATKPPQ